MSPDVNWTGPAWWTRTCFFMRLRDTDTSRVRELIFILLNTNWNRINTFSRLCFSDSLNKVWDGWSSCGDLAGDEERCCWFVLTERKRPDSTDTKTSFSFLARLCSHLAALEHLSFCGGASASLFVLQPAHLISKINLKYQLILQGQF